MGSWEIKRAPKAHFPVAVRSALKCSLAVLYPRRPSASPSCENQAAVYVIYMRLETHVNNIDCCLNLSSGFSRAVSWTYVCASSLFFGGVAVCGDA